MTLQHTLDHLSTLARDAGADLTTSLSLQRGGVVATLYWTPTNDDVPRECSLIFGADGDEDDAFLFGWVVAPEQWMHLVDEGMSAEGADDAARRLVETVDDVARYLVGVSYAWVKPGAANTPAARSGLDSVT